MGKLHGLVLSKLLGISNLGLWLYVVSSWGAILDAGGRYSDVWHRGVRTGPFVRKGAR